MNKFFFFLLIILFFISIGSSEGAGTKKTLKYPHVTIINEYRHFETIQGASSRPLMVLLFLDERALHQFSLACGDKGGRTSCLAIDLSVSSELAGQLLSEATQQPVTQLYPVVLMWYNKRFQPLFKPDLTFESITYFFDRITSPPLTSLTSPAQLAGFLATDKPLVLAYFPESSFMIDDQHYELRQWYQALARGLHHRLLFLEMNDPELADKPIIDTSRPFIMLHTDHWQPRLMPKKLWKGEPEVAAQWLLERSFGSAQKVSKSNFDKFVRQAGERPLFLIWVREFAAKNEKYTDMAHILSTYFDKWLSFAVSALVDPHAAASDDTDDVIVDVGPSSMGVLREELPVATILVPQPHGQSQRYLFRGPLTVEALKDWIDQFMRGQLHPLVRSQDMSDGAYDQNILYLAHDYWEATVGNRGDYTYLVIFWNSEFLDLCVPLMRIFYEAANVLLDKYHLDRIIVASFDLAKNDLPPGVDPPQSLVEPRLFLPAPDLGVMSLPAGYVDLSGDQLAQWLIFRALEHGSKLGHLSDEFSDKLKAHQAAKSSAHDDEPEEEINLGKSSS